MATVGQRLVRLRKKKGVTQSQLAETIGITRDRYARYEIDDTQMDYDTLDKIANYHDVSVDFLLGRSDFPQLNSEQSDLKNIEQIYDDILYDRVLDVDGKPFTTESKANYLQQLDLLIQLRKLQTQNK